MSEHQHEFQCNQMLGNLSEYIDGNLQADLCAQIEEHMKTCENCTIVVNTLRKTVELYEKCCEEEAEIPGEVKERLFAKLEIREFLKK